MRKILPILLSLGFSLIGYAQTALPTSWNFFSPSVSNPPNGWTFGIGLNGTGGLTYQATIGSDNVQARLDATGEFVTIFFADKPGPVSYYLRGTGVSPQPSFTGEFDIQESTDGITYTNMRVFNTANPIPGTNPGTKYTNQPASTSRYIRFFYASKQLNSNVALDSILVRSAPPATTSGINVKIGATTIVNNSTTVIGTTAATNFSINNIGTVQSLTIDSVVLSGDAKADYSLGTVPASISGLSAQTLTLNLTPSTNGSRLASLKIYSNDAAKNPYTINLYGIGGTLASEPTAAPASVSITNVKSHVFNVTIADPSPKPEKYILLRKKAGTITEVPVDGVTYTRGSTIGAAVVAYVGDTAIKNLQPTYIFANSAYTFSAFSFNGPSGYENYLTSASATATTTTLGKQPGNYYSTINPDVNTFLTDLRNKINPHTAIFYSLYAPRLMTGYMARDTTAGKYVVNCVYTNLPYIYDGAFLWWNGSNGANLSREHSWAQSLMPSQIANSGTWPTETATNAEYPEYNDMHHLFPADQTNANAVRSNFPFDNVVNVTSTSPTGQGKKGTNASNTTVYEPRPEHKGDLARALMYMSVCYNTIHGYNWQFPANQSEAILKLWHQQDPPSDFEIARHEYVFSQQNNRNPFIDNPDWADRVKFSNMTYIPVTSTQDETWKSSITVYPNPTSEQLSIDASGIFETAMPYQLTDTKGAVVATGLLNTALSSITMPETEGIYILRLQTPKGPYITKVTKN